MNDSFWNILKQIEEISKFCGDKLHKIDKDEVEAILVAFKQKKELWASQKKYYYELTGFDVDFDLIVGWLIANTRKPVTFDEFLALSDEETENFFDLWSIVYLEERQKLREKLRRQLKAKLKKGENFDFQYVSHEKK